MKLFLNASSVRVYLTHQIASQIPTEVSQGLYDLADDFQQTDDATIFTFPQTRIMRLCDILCGQLPPRFPIVIAR